MQVESACEVKIIVDETRQQNAQMAPATQDPAEARSFQF